MQRVVRSTLVGLLTIAGITACGDKVTIPPVTSTTVLPSSVVHQVVVSPQNATLNVGDKITLAASVNADAGVTDRTVTWSSSNAAIASVDANGVVTAVAAGNATITAKSKADPTVSGAAIITVNAINSQPAVVTISSVNATVCSAVTGTCSSVPANLGNATGQLDVIVNVDPGTQKLAGVDLIMNCNAAANFPTSSDTVVATQNLSGTNTAPVAEAASAPVTLSFNTASFNSTTGATAFKNGQCILRARARTSTGQVVASSNQSLTLANTDVVIGSITATKTATDPGGLLWNGGNVTVNVIPVFFTAGRTAATTNVTFEGKTQILTNTAGGAASATFVDGNDFPANTGATDIDNITDPNAGASLSVAVVDASGQTFSTNPCGAALCTAQSVLAGAPASIFPATAPFRLDTQKPLPGTLALQNNALQGTSTAGTGVYLGSNFRFAADSAAGFRGPNANFPTNQVICTNSANGTNTVTCNADNRSGVQGVDKVTVTFLQGTCSSSCSSSSTFTSVTNTSSLNETNTATANTLIQISTDALGNADTAFVNGTEFTSAGAAAPSAARFGVDKTAPTITQAGGPANNSLNRDSSKVIGGTGSYIFTISDNLAGPRAQQLVAQTSLTQNISSSTFSPPAENTVYTNGSENSGGPCVIGRYNATAAAAGPNALPVFARDGTAEGFCTPVPYTLTGGSSIAANFPGTTTSAASSSLNQGYFTTEVIAIDAAGNQSAPVVKTVAEDATTPTVGAVDLPGSFTGNSTATWSAAASDNVDLVGSVPSVIYNSPSNGGGGSLTLQYPATAGPGTPWDNVLTRSGTMTYSVPNFIKNLQVNSGTGAAATAAAGNASAVLSGAADEVGNLGQANSALGATFTLSSGSTSSFSTSTFTGSFVLTSNNTTLSDCPTAGCAGGAATANPTTATLTATAQGTSGTFNNPFSGGAVGIWYQTTASAANNTWFFAGNAGAGSARDTGVGGSRFWDYVFTFTPPKIAPDGTVLTGGTTINVRAIGVNTNGDGMATPPITLTLTNP